MNIFSYFMAVSGLAVAVCTALKLPLETSTRYIVDQTGTRFKMACVNWPAHMETYLPEGLADRTFEEMVAQIKVMQFNCVRLTFSVEQVLHRLERTVEQALMYMSPASAKKFVELQSWIPSINQTLAWDVLERAVEVLNEAGILVLFDQHMSQAKWCCGFFDGNRWWGEKHFPVDEWMASLKFSAEWAKKHPNIIAIGLRNEVDEVWRIGSGPVKDWLKYMRQGAALVHQANPDLLVVVGGMRSASYFGMLKDEAFITAEMPATINRKIVYEVHYYNFAYVRPFWGIFGSTITCKYMRWFLNSRALFLLDSNSDSATFGPMIMSEFGLNVEAYDPSHPRQEDTLWFNCLRDILHEKDVDIGYWVLVSHYYQRDSQLDNHEAWGLLRPDPLTWLTGPLHNENVTLPDVKNPELLLQLQGLILPHEGPGVNSSAV